MEIEAPNSVLNGELLDETQLMDSEIQLAILESQPTDYETQPIDSEIQLTVLEPQPTDNETQPIETDYQLAVLEPQPTENVTQPIASETQLAVLEPKSETQLAVSEESRPIKRRKKQSDVWEHFTLGSVGNNCRRAFCNQCNQSFAYSNGPKVVGTSHLMRHIVKGTCSPVLHNQENNQSGQYNASSNKGNFSGAPRRRYQRASVPSVAFDADRCRQEIARMIIKHDYPLHMIEHPGFVDFVRCLQPRFDMVSFNALQGECLATYHKEKQSIQKAVEGMAGRVCLTLDLWPSSHTIGYVFVSGQFVDCDWKLQRRLLNVIVQPYPYSDTAFSHSVSECLSDWGMGGKLFSLTINQRLSEAAVDNLRALLTVDKPSVLNGQLLVGSCLARSMSGIVVDAYSSMKGIIQKVSNSVKYVKSLESCEEKFLELKQQLQVPSSRFLAIDDRTKWNTTYEMLLAALELKEVFSCLDTLDPDYKGAPSADDWMQIKLLCTSLKPFYDTANLLTQPGAQTTNTFFHEVWKIKLELARGAASEDPVISSLTKSMQDKFDRYWNSSCFVLAVAVVVDPRFKMKLVEFCFSKLYGEESAKYVKVVDDGIHGLFHEYATRPLHPTPSSNSENGPKVEEVVGLSEFDAYMMETTSQLAKSELDQYLEESLLPRELEFNVIGWWKMNRTKYPALSKMACDVLSVPVCTVSGSSVFDTVRKEMDSYRCSLSPVTLEALICTKDWLTQSENNNAGTTSAQMVKMEVPI